MADAFAGEADRLAHALTNTGTTGDVVSLQVADVTASGGVNLQLGDGSLLLEVSCPDSYRNRKAGDWVAVRMSSVPVVLWRLGEDPGEVDEATIQTLAKEVSLDEQVIRAATWGTAAPSGDGWQTVQTLYLRKNAEGKVELYGQLASQSDSSPDAPPARAPKPVTISPTTSGSWRNGRPDDYADWPMQGDWTGGGNRRGAWFYGSKIADACQGRTVASMKVALTRRKGSGVTAKRPLHLYLHGYTSPPSGQLSLGSGPEELLSLSVGAKGLATLPASWRSALASGSARGLAIYASGSRDYMAVSNGRITITFS